MLNKLIQKRRQVAASSDERLRGVKRNIYTRSIGLVVFIVVVTVTLLFAVTTAWYTNTIAVNGLTFKAEAWGFDGSVSVSEEAIEAAPGDSGLIELHIKNKSDLASSIGLSISKQYMEEAQMQKRIYFYVDKTAVVNGETIDKVYLNNSKGYSYTLYGHNELILSEEICTDVPLKWEWVYDVVGYYFVGTIDQIDQESAIVVEEYLRPVEYSFDDATYDEDGNLLTVDGEKTIVEYLSEITAADGYEGAYTVADDKLMYGEEEVAIEVPNCYPVDIENNIWIYFCTKVEIEANTVWDTLYGTTAETDKRSYQARISVTGEQLNQQVVTLEANSDLTEALNSNSGNIVRLSNNITATSSIKVGVAATEDEEGVYVNALVDLNGCEINVTDAKLTSIFEVAEGSSLTLFNGVITGDTGTKASGVKAVGSAVTMNNISMSGLNTGVYIEDNASNGANSTVIITDCDLEASVGAVRIIGDGYDTAAMTQLIVQDSRLVSTTFSAIYGNGTIGKNGSNGTTIQVINSTLEGYYASIYHPQMDSVLSIESSTLKGMTGLAVKGGDIRISNSKVIGTATDDSPIVVPTEDKLSMSGFSDTGDGIYIESNYGYPVKLTITGDCEISHNARTARAIRVFPEAEHVKVYIDGGVFTSDVSDFLTEEYQCVEEEKQVEGSEETITVYKVSLKEETNNEEN